MVRLLGVVFGLFLSTLALANGPPPLDYSVGLAIAIEPDGDFSETQRMLVRLTPEGKLSMRAPDRSGSVEVKPAMSFYWDTDGEFRRATIEVGNKLAVETKGLTRDVGISSRPTVVLGEDGSTWLVVPSSLIPSVNGFSPSGIPGASEGARDLLRAFNVPTRREAHSKLFASLQGERTPVGATGAFGGACVQVTASLPSMPAQTVDVQQALNYRLEEPMLRWQQGNETRDYEAFRRAWRRFVTDNPASVKP